MADHSGPGVTLEALLADDTFAALLKSWEVDRRCPICLADYLREQGFEDEAVAAEWAANGRSRVHYDDKLAYGPYPATFVHPDTGQKLGTWWMSEYRAALSMDIPAHPGGNMSRQSPPLPFPSILLWMLDYGARNVELFRRPVTLTAAGNAP